MRAENPPDSDQPLNFSEPEGLRLLRDSLRKFVTRDMPKDRAREWDHSDLFPKDVYTRLTRLGVMGLTVPEEYGGAGRNIVARKQLTADGLF